MPAPFAALEDRVNRAVLARLANVTATVDGVAVDGVFDEAYAVLAEGAPVGMEGRQPVLSIRTESVPTNPHGRPVVVRSVNYTIVGHQPDGAGMSVLILERAA